MCPRFEEWKEDLQRYCENNALDYDKARKLARCWNEDTLVLQHYDPEDGKRGLLDETPAPVALIISRGPNGPQFEQTEFTQKYLAS